MKYPGLSTQHAKTLLDEHGPNVIATKTNIDPFNILIRQFTSFLVLLLIIASISSVLLGDLLDGFFILIIVILNGILGFVQEYKAEKAILALKQMVVTNVRVVRDGSEQTIDSRNLVPGDVIILEEGNKIPADCMLLESINLEVNEASLTGESVPVEKNWQNNKKNLIYLGTIVTKGRAQAQVDKTGAKTRFGQIAVSLSAIKVVKTPLQNKLDTLGKQLGLLAILASITIFVIGIISREPLVELILSSISLAVAAVPEGLPAVITITLAVGMQKMARKKALLSKLSSIEALGNTTVIATDKTGTLTKNEMRVENVWINQNTFLVDDPSLKKQKSTFDQLIRCGVVCNTSALTKKGESSDEFKVVGDTTEGALLLLAQNFDDIGKIRSGNKLITEYPFETKLKTMTVVVEDKSDNVVYSKGAPETILSKSTHILIDSKLVKITTEIEAEFKATLHRFATEGLRVIALAYKEDNNVPKNRDDAESKLTLIGLIGIADPFRPEVIDAISVARSAGIRTIMITGDNPVTAHAIGSKVGLIQPGDKVMTGTEFETMSDAEVYTRLDSIRIFARTTPDQKLRIIQLLQNQGHVVTVTGDGVNDALALKQADVGVAMGITGTDVAKEASDMVITDDNYATLVTAVEEGRNIFQNIKSAIKYLVGCNIGEVVSVVVGVLLGWPLILTPLQLLYINLVTDGLPAIALAISPKHERVMMDQPRTNTNIFDKSDLLWLFEVSLLTTFATLTSFYFGYRINDLMLARSLAFITLILCQQLILLDVWTKDKSIIRSKAIREKIFIFTFFGTVILQLFLIYVPVLSQVFKITSLSINQITFALMMSTVLLVASEFRKLILGTKPISASTHDHLHQ